MKISFRVRQKLSLALLYNARTELIHTRDQASRLETHVPDASEPLSMTSEKWEATRQSRQTSLIGEHGQQTSTPTLQPRP